MSRRHRRYILALLGVALLALPGCKRRQGLRNSMAIQPKFETYQPNGYFADSASERPLPAGTVPRDPDRVPGHPYAVTPYAGPSREADFASSRSIPFPVTAQVLNAGQENFNIYCAVCHGRLGNAEGMIVQRGFTRPPSFHIDRLKSAPDLHFFDVMSNGYGAMFSYAERVTPRQRWEIVAYIRALQMSADVAGAPEDVRRALIAEGDRQTPATALPSGGRK